MDLHLTDRTWDYSCGAVIAPVDAPVGRLVVGSHGNSWAWSAGSRNWSPRLPHVVPGGDFNAEPHTSSMRFFTGRTSLEGFSTAYGDAWEVIRGDEPGCADLAPREPAMPDTSAAGNPAGR